MQLLTSNGLSSSELRAAIEPYLRGRRMALVVTATNPYKSSSLQIARLRSELESLGAQVTVFDFDKQSPEELRTFDGAEMIGGNPFYLMHSVRKHGFEQVLRDLASEKVLIGISAGAFVMSRSLEPAYLYSRRMNAVGLQDPRGLATADLELLVHYAQRAAQYPDFPDRCAAFFKDRDCQPLRLSDGDGLLITAEGQQLIKTE